MKKTITAVLALAFVISFSQAVFAKTSRTAASSSGDYEVDGSIGFATGPGDFSSGNGVNFGFGAMLPDIDKNLQARVDISFFDFSYTYRYVGSGYDLSYTRIPITVSARYYLPINSRFKAFAQAGLETSIDSYDYVVAGNRHSKSEVNLGISPGGGAEFVFNPQISFFVLGRIHIISDEYFSMQFGGAFHF